MISAIQPIANFSMIMPPTPISPAEVVSIASDLVTTPTTSTIVTLGETQPASQPLFDSSGNLVPPGTQAQTPESQALANELTAALNGSSPSLDNLTVTIQTDTFLTTGTLLTTGTTPASSDFATLLETNLLNAAGLSSAGLANSASLTDFSGILGANIELAIAGIGTGGGGTNANALNVAATNALLTAPTTTTTTTTITTPVTAPTATAPAATVLPAVAPTVTAPAATVPTATAPAATVPAATVPTATAPAATTTPAVVAAATAVTATTVTPPTGLTPADILQQLLADVNGRAIANLTDAGFAATAAGLFASAAIFRTTANVTVTTIGTSDIAGTPPGEVTATQPARTV